MATPPFDLSDVGERTTSKLRRTLRISVEGSQHEADVIFDAIEAYVDAKIAHAIKEYLNGQRDGR